MNISQKILSTYLHVREDGSTVVIPASDSFWQELGRGYHPELERGRLMTAFTFSEPWSLWERHPAGEELVMLLSGTVTLVLVEAGNERVVQLNSVGDYVLVPRNAWHTARTTVPTTMLFLTPGAGTEHRPVKA